MSRKKRGKAAGKNIIIFDEFNNGFDIGNNHKQNPQRSPMIVAAYLSAPNSRSGIHTRPLSNGYFNPKRTQDAAEAIYIAKKYFFEHPWFYYTLICPEETKKEPVSSIKANTIALLTFEFFKKYNLNPRKTAVRFHTIDGKENSEVVRQNILSWAEQAKLHGLTCTHASEDQSSLITLAHNTCYSLACLSFLPQRDNLQTDWAKTEYGWPLPDRFVDPGKRSQLEKTARDLAVEHKKRKRKKFSF